MAGKFDGKVALITGAASGIGRATAHKLASLGATLALFDVDAPGLDDCLASLPPPSPTPSPAGTTTTTTRPAHAAHLCDVSSSASVDRAVALVLDPSSGGPGRLDLIFNCAGVNPTALAIGDTSDAYFDRLVGVNLRGPYNVTRAVAPHLRPGAAVVNVASVAGLRASWGFSIVEYCATKFGVVGFTKAMALELGPKGVRVNCVAPGPTDTPTMAGNVAGGGEHNDKLVAGIALGRLGQPEDVADVVAFLLSDESRFMNGSVVEISGGQG